MSVFEIEGVAKREVLCDIANITISFKARGTNSHDVSQTVMDECDEFLEEMKKTGMELSEVHYEDDDVGGPLFQDNDDVSASRTIKIRVPFDMKIINMIQSILQRGKYDFKFDIKGDLSNRAEILMELAQEALKKSKLAAEKLAEVLDIKVKGVESIRKDRWDGDLDRYEIGERERGLYVINSIGRPSDDIGAKVVEESVNLKIKWILE